MLEWFFGAIVKIMQTMFEELSSNINGLNNLVALDRSIQSLFHSATTTPSSPNLT